MAVAGHLEQPTRGFRGAFRLRRIGRCGSHLAAYLALLRLGVAVPLAVARSAVGSYPTVSPLPFAGLAAASGRSVFCGPFRRLSAPRRYLAVYPRSSDFPRRSSRPPATIAPDPWVKANPSGAGGQRAGSRGSAPCRGELVEVRIEPGLTGRAHRPGPLHHGT